MFVCPECGGSLASEGRCPTDGAAVQPIGEDLLLGTTIGAYRVARLLGVGGMGRVYKGVHPTIGSRVAIKVLSRECSDRRDLVERFFAEAKAVNLIRHESIVNVLDLATLPDGRPYIIMEYLDGAPLASIVEHAVQMRTPLPLGGLARLAVEVLDALAAAHAKGVVHRDLKPDNIFVTPSGRPKVLDFGIAKLNDMSTGSATRTGSLLGTPHYMSPEQAGGRPVDHRADIYAIGVILFECATGQKPFQAESLFDLLRMHVEAPPPSPRALRSELSVDLEQVILTALAKPPDQRFASAQAMSAALQHATAQLAPEQWTPITGSGTHRAVPSGAWQPTAPASWGGGVARAPRESVQPPLIGHQSTVSASSGQVQKQPAPPPPSRKGLWIGLGSVLLVGGGVTAAVVAGGGGGGAAAGSSAPIAVADPAEPEKPDEPDEPAEPAEPDEARPEPTERAAPPPVVPADHVANSLDEQAEDAQAALDQAFARLEQTDLKHVPPSVKKQLEQMKQIGKLPPAERMKRLEKLQEELSKGIAEDLAEALDPSPGSSPGSSPGAGARPPSSPSRQAGRWIEDHELAPFRLDPRRVDVSAFIKFAIAEARRADPEAVLFRIEADGVSPDGFANLELPSHASDTGSIALRFYSPSRSRRDPSLPIGVTGKSKQACEFRIEAEPDGVELRAISFADCSKNIAVPIPRCSVADLWKKAINKNAPSTNAVANLSYYGFGKSVQWHFDIGSGHDKVFSARFPPC